MKARVVGFAAISDRARSHLIISNAPFGDANGDQVDAAAVYAAIGARNADLFDFSHVQHDAEELFTFVLSTMHDELMEHCPGFQPPDSSSSTGVAGGSGVSAAGDDDDDGAWAEVGPKKTATKLSASTRMTLCYMLWIVLCVLRERVSFTP